jgi:hypothetical protein
VAGVKMKKYILNFIFLISLPSYAGMTCDSLFSKNSGVVLKKQPISAEVQSKFYELISEVYKLDLEKSYKQLYKLDWFKYAALSKLQEYITLEKISSQTVNVKFLLAPFIAESKLISIEMNKLLKNEEYKLKYQRHLDRNYSFYQILENINQRLGANIFPTARFDLVQTNENTILEAEALIQRMNFDLEKDFSLSGHKNLEELRTYAVDHSPEAKTAVNLLENDVIVALHRPENARFWLPMTGFQNQRTTGSSGGSLDEALRNKGEAACTGIPLKEYANKSVRFMPNYAEIVAPFDGSYTNVYGASQYGTDLWIVKKDVTSKRATLTAGDSLEMAITGATRSALDHFIPWAKRLLLVDRVAAAVKGFLFSFENPIARFRLSHHRWKDGWGYYEVQIFGALTLEHGDALYFKNNPPDAALSKLLRSKNIKIYDARAYDLTGEKPTAWLE